MSAQADGEYSEALDSTTSSRARGDPYDRSYILYNVALIHASNGEHERALGYYEQALAFNPRMIKPEQHRRDLPLPGRN